MCLPGTGKMVRPDVPFRGGVHLRVRRSTGQKVAARIANAGLARRPDCQNRARANPAYLSPSLPEGH